MNNLVREKLSEIIAGHGRSLAADPQRCEALLRDYCPQYKREINVLVEALKERVVADLMNSSPDTPGLVLRAKLTRRLQDELGFSEEASKWAVDSWATALGVAPVDESAESNAEQVAPNRAKQPATIHHAAHVADPDDPFSQGRAASPPSSQPEEILRQALRIVFADDHATEYEKADLQTIRQRLGVPVDVASRIFAEVKKERQQANQKVPVAAASAPMLVVSQKGGAQYSSINQAIRSAGPGARISVRPGVYRESLIVDKPIQIMGDGPTEQIIVESQDSPCLILRAREGEVRGLSLHCYVEDDRADCPAIDIGYGQMLLEGCDVVSNSSVCISIHGPGAAPTIRQCRIHDGSNYGVWLWDNAAGLVEECEIVGMSGAGIMISGDTMEEARQMAESILADMPDKPSAVDDPLSESTGNTQPAGLTSARPIARRCTIHGGQDHGVWVHYKGRGAIEHCRIFDNAMAGVWVDQKSESAIRHCGINRNGWEAIRVTGSSSAIVEDCDLSENTNGAWAVEQGCQVRQSSNKD
jgi:hypothetical protein